MSTSLTSLQYRHVGTTIDCRIALHDDVFYRNRATYVYKELSYLISLF
jgi:hypothetical protein